MYIGIQKRFKSQIVCIISLLILVNTIFTPGILKANIIYVPSDYPTIQTAINASQDGDQIIVAPGIYNETLDLRGKAIHLLSSDGPDVTTIDATGIHGCVVACVNNETNDTILEGFTITGGTGANSKGGGMFNSSGSPTVINCLFIDNFLDTNELTFGGGIYNENNNQVVIVGCTFVNNTAGKGGAICNRYNNALIINCNFTSNRSRDGGSAIYNDESDSTISYSEFYINSTSDKYGAVLSEYSSPVINDCIFKSNSAGSDGAAIANYNRSSSWDNYPLIYNCTFDSNTSKYAGAIFNGNKNHASIINCTFIRNRATYNAGAIENSGDYTIILDCIFENNNAGLFAGAVNCKSEANSVIRNCIFRDNNAQNGAGMFVSNYANVLNCTFTNNKVSNNGGAIFTQYSSARLVNCLFDNNSADNSGGGIFNFKDSHSVISNCIFSDNFANKTGGAVYNASECNPVINNSIFWNNISNGNSDEIYNEDNDTTKTVIANCNIQNSGGSGIAWNTDLGLDAGGNIEADPIFADPANGDYHLSSGSPCIDAGDNSKVPQDTYDLDEDENTVEPIPFDIDGNSRLLDDLGKPDIGSGIAPIVDIGAYEYQNTSVTTLTVWPTPLIADQQAVFAATNALPDEKSWLLYSINGIGDTYFKFLDVTVNLNSPKLLIGPGKTNENGFRRVEIMAPSIGDQPLDIWFQYMQDRAGSGGVVSNYIGTRIMP